MPTIVPSNPIQLNFSRWRHKSQASQLEITFTTAPQLEAIVTIKSAGDWPWRYVIQIKHSEMIWQLAPCLRFQEAEAILSTLQLLGVDLSLDQDESRPIESERIHRLVEILVDASYSVLQEAA